jgi:uncharacterized DUF497 family protein
VPFPFIGNLDMYAQMCICFTVSYEWDPVKAQANFEKHGIHFADAATTLEDDLALTIRAPPSRRTKTVGLLSVRMLLGVYSSWFTHGEGMMPA